jgi:basic amino acid/polyamine antiporter, APA family
VERWPWVLLVIFIPCCPPFPSALPLVAAILILTLVNYFGIQKAGRLNIGIVLISVLSLLIFVVAGISSVRTENYQPFAPAGFEGILQSAALLFFAYTGYARLATLGEEVSNPRQTIPRAIILALGIAILLYMAVAVVAVGSAGTASMASSSSPLENAARGFQFPQVSRVVAVGATTAMLGVLAQPGAWHQPHDLCHGSPPGFAWIFRSCASKIRGSRPRTDPYGAGHAAGRFVGYIGSDCLSGCLFTILVYYSIANLAALRMRSEDRLFPVWIPVLGLISCLTLAATLPPRIILSGLGLLIAGFLLRWLYRRQRVSPGSSILISK